MIDNIHNFYNYIPELTLPYYIKFIYKRISEKFSLYENNNIPQILIISMPPRSLKTTLSIKYFANWVGDNYSNKKIGIFSYSTDAVSINIKQKIHDNLKDRVYNLNSDNAKTDILIVDDPLKGIEDIKRSDYIYTIFSNILYRISFNPFILIFCTRFDKDDFVGKLLKNLKIGDKTFMIDYINIEALATKNDILGRPIGQSFDPDKYNKNSLLNIKNVIGEKMFEIMYQGNPQ